MSIVAILQARASSSRLPNKVLMPILGVPMLQHQIERVNRSRFIDKLVVATSDEASDDDLAEQLRLINVDFYRGSLDDVLDRFYQAAKESKPTHVVRLTGDCPLIDYEVIDQVIRRHLDSGADYTSNSNPPSYPDGLDVEIMQFNVLEKTWELATRPSDREHVTSYIRKPENKFKLENVEYDTDLSGFRWTVDEYEDFQFVEKVYSRLFSTNHDFLMKDILCLLKSEPKLSEINKHFIRNEGYFMSLKKDDIPS